MATGGCKLSANIEENFLECGICLQNFQDPRALPCLHTFCCECLRKWVGASVDKSVVICPVCKKKADIPDEDVAGFPAHLLVNNLIESIQKTKPESTAITCTNCDISATATVHCTDCQEYLCHNCHKSHMILKALRNHKIVTLKSEAETYYQPEKTNDKEGYCTIHNEGVQYYCKNEHKLVCPICVSEKNCHIEHDRISLKDKENRTAYIRGLKQECVKIKVKYEDELQKTKEVEKKLLSAKEMIKTTIKDLMDRYQKREDVNKINANRYKVISKIKDELTSTLLKIDKAYEQGSSINLASSEQKVIDTLVSLTEVFQLCSTSSPSVEDISLDHLKFVIEEKVKPDIGLISDSLEQAEWKPFEQFNLPKSCVRPVSIAINQCGEIAVTSHENGVVVLSRTGRVNCYLNSCRKQTLDIAVTNYNRFIVPGNTKLLCYASYGKQLTTINVADKRTQALAVDKWGRIIAFTLRNNKGPWSVHNADGVEIVSFPSVNQYPLRLEATYTGDIVYIHCDVLVEEMFAIDPSLRLMDYLGGNVRVINPPPQVMSWEPVDVCCSKQHSEIYVVNRLQPSGIYKYTAQGDYVSCLTTDVNEPVGIALSPDEKELFVVEQGRQVVKILQRQ